MTSSTGHLAARQHADHPQILVAVLIPCLNEAAAIGSVVAEFRRELPDAWIVVIDNGSTDGTARVAADAGAEVIREPRRGKGFAVRAGFRDVDADVYVLADGDGQTAAARVHDLIRPILDDRADMVVGSRALTWRGGKRTVNDLGNLLFSHLLRLLLGVQVSDVLSGYRALGRDLVKGLPLASRNFEVEVELTVKTTQRSYRLLEVPVQSRPRMDGTRSRLRVASDGFRILWAILVLYRDYRPMAFFSLIALAFALAALATLLLGGDVGFAHPSSVAAVLLAMAAMVSVATAAVLSVLARRFTELEGKVDLAVRPGRRRARRDD